MNYSLERLDRNQLGHMRSLNKLFGAVFGDKQSYQNELPSDNYLTLFLSEQNNIVLVAVNDNVVIGGLVAYVLQKFEIERSEILVYDLAVAVGYQRKGIATALMKKVQDIASGIGVYVVFVQADEGDEAIEFYRSLNPSEDIKTRNFDFIVKPTRST